MEIKENLSTDEKLELLDALWQSVIQDQSNVPITDEQRAELNRRLFAYEIDKDKGESWEIVRKRITES